MSRPVERSRGDADVLVDQQVEFLFPVVYFRIATGGHVDLVTQRITHCSRIQKNISEEVIGDGGADGGLATVGKQETERVCERAW